MKFESQYYPVIKLACEKKQEIIFETDRKITVFSNVDAPQEWTEYPPSLLPPQGYAHVMIQSGQDLRGALIRLELVVHLDGGKIYYRKLGEELVELKVTWPNA